MQNDYVQQLKLVTSAAANHYSACIAAAKKLRTMLDDDLQSGTTTQDEWALVAFTCSSALINFADHTKNKQAAELGTRFADDARDFEDIEHYVQRNLEYNAANGRVVQYLIAAGDPIDSATHVSSRLLHRDILREARTLFSLVGYDKTVAGTLRGTALCNLANQLDDSGRWVEAYQIYVDALDADPTNGNAAGNAAELLRRRISSGRGQLGHYAAVHDAFLRQAHEHRVRTVELAGEATAQRWDDAPFLEGHGHLEHAGDPLNPYQQWIKDHRLALTFAVDGLGSDDPRWDSATIESLRVTSADIPPIYASINVLKAEYLVSRRLAFSGEQKLYETPFGQNAEDTGVYVDTLDMAVYGEASSSLVLAQRSTLDILDKVAVAANEHFAIGDTPGSVTFRKFWVKGNPPAIRSGLPIEVDRWIPSALCLTELAYDAQPDGLYASAQALRNAGTHRLVNLSWGAPKTEANSAHVPVEADYLVSAAHQSLTVARAAFLYLLDLVADKEEAHPWEGPVGSLPLYFQD